jgi:hypothetical protein
MWAKMRAVEAVSIHAGLKSGRLSKALPPAVVDVSCQMPPGSQCPIDRFETGRRQTAVEFAAPANIAVARLRFTPARRKILIPFASKV